MAERLYHEIQCPTLTKTGPCTCQPVIVADGPDTGERWQPVPVPLGNGKHDVGDSVRAAIAQRLIEDFGRVSGLTPGQVHHLALLGAASVRALLHELGTLRDMENPPS